MKRLPIKGAVARAPEMERSEPADGLSWENYRLGMPHLAFAGLSETWLLKELGHRHWLLLAEAAGMPVPHFQDADGATVYAAFNGLSIRNAAFLLACEHDELLIGSEIAKISRTQLRSRHHLICNGKSIGDVELISIFVKRTSPGCNRTIVRVGQGDFAGINYAVKCSEFVAQAANIRSGNWLEHLGFLKSGGQDRRRFAFDPCPSQDFNGAGFLYCASFQGFADRAEWELLRPHPMTTSTIRRDIVFHGNVQTGERISLVLNGVRHNPHILAHWFVVLRKDGSLLADVFTIRELTAPADGV